jgi:hypothetical protein
MSKTCFGYVTLNFTLLIYKLKRRIVFAYANIIFAQTNYVSMWLKFLLKQRSYQ